MMFAGGEESRSDLFEASVASVAFVVRDPCPGVGQVPRSFWFRGTRQIGEQTSHGETVKYRYLIRRGAVLCRALLSGCTRVRRFEGGSAAVGLQSQQNFSYFSQVAPLLRILDPAMPACTWITLN